ncbi:MAG: methyltransferase domain-containing protein [Pyrinomonadaceae bacterium]|nr:methyltransferase domain-containing protein [Phycisphaerales bacterium]
MSEPIAFVGSIPQTYHRYLGPLLFEEYAQDIVKRLRLRPDERVLELAAGTGIVTRLLARALPPGATLTATDLKEPMLAVARTVVPTDSRVSFKETDACALPFENASFDAIACQFGLMFFPDKLLAMREARRVLVPGGRYVFNVWDALEHNPIPRIIHETVAGMFPANPPSFLKAAPYGYFDPTEIERVVRAAGFTKVAAHTIEFPSIAPTAQDAARAFIEGTPLLAALQERGIKDPTPIREAAEQALRKHLGDTPCKATMQALVFEVA